MICRDEYTGPFWDTAGRCAHPCLCHRTGTREGPCLPKEKADVCCQSTRSIAPPSPGSSIALQHSSDLAKHSQQAAAQGLHCRVQAPLHFPISGLPLPPPSLPYTPAPQASPWIPFGVSPLGALLSCPFCPGHPPRLNRSQHF